MCQGLGQTKHDEISEIDRTLILGHGPMRRFGLGLRVTSCCSQMDNYYHDIVAIIIVMMIIKLLFDYIKLLLAML